MWKQRGDFLSVSLRTLIADKGDSLIQCADFRNCLPTHDAPVSSGPLAVMQGRNLKYDRSRLVSPRLVSSRLASDET